MLFVYRSQKAFPDKGKPRREAGHAKPRIRKLLTAGLPKEKTARHELFGKHEYPEVGGLPCPERVHTISSLDLGLNFRFHSYRRSQPGGYLPFPSRVLDKPSSPIPKTQRVMVSVSLVLIGQVPFKRCSYSSATVIMCLVTIQ